jgi:hypothetical protein
VTFCDFNAKSVLGFFNIKCCMCIAFSALRNLNDLNKSLAEYCQQKLPNGFKAEIGQPCCAFFAGKLQLVSL